MQAPGQDGPCTAARLWYFQGFFGTDNGIGDGEDKVEPLFKFVVINLGWLSSKEILHR